MERSILFTLICGLAINANAQLAPQEPASLFDHMVEVNAEWNNQAPDLAHVQDLVAFASEAERIATHLHLVQQQLQARTDEGLSASRFAERANLLEALGAYADRGLFPQNEVLPFRNPIFIDPYGTACAVGHLMIESGANELAQRIDAEMELAYIHEMKWPAIDDWASDHGFSGDELAWIQPGYPPNVAWAALAGGTNGTVNEVLPLANGDLVIAGEFTEAGGNSLVWVARWNGTAYSAMGSLPEGTVACSIEFDGSIYLGGSFFNGAIDLLRWNGSAWETQAVFSSKYAEVTALHVHNGALHAAGSESGFAGVDHGVKRLDNGIWNFIGQPLNGPIHALETFDGALVSGGAFTDNFLSTGNAISHVAWLNGNVWEQLGDGLDGSVQDMLVYQDELYAGGDMISDITSYFGLARIDIGALNWTPLMPNLTNYIFSPVDGLVQIKAMVEKDGRIFLGGDFYVVQGLTEGQGLVVFNGIADDVEPYCQFLGPVLDVCLLGDQELVICGASSIYQNIASTDLSTGIRGTEQRLELSISPNPTIDVVTVQLPDELGKAPIIKVIDSHGRIVSSITQPVLGLVRIDTKDLATGPYIIEVVDGTNRATGRFVKE